MSITSNIAGHYAKPSKLEKISRTLLSVKPINAVAGVTAKGLIGTGNLAKSAAKSIIGSAAKLSVVTPLAFAAHAVKKIVGEHLKTTGISHILGGYGGTHKSIHKMIFGKKSSSRSRPRHTSSRPRQAPTQPQSRGPNTTALLSAINYMSDSIESAIDNLRFDTSNGLTGIETNLLNLGDNLNTSISALNNDTQQTLSAIKMTLNSIDMGIGDVNKSLSSLPEKLEWALATPRNGKTDIDDEIDKDRKDTAAKETSVAPEAKEKKDWLSGLLGFLSLLIGPLLGLVTAFLDKGAEAAVAVALAAWGIGKKLVKGAINLGKAVGRKAWNAVKGAWDWITGPEKRGAGKTEEPTEPRAERIKPLPTKNPVMYDKDGNRLTDEQIDQINDDADKEAATKKNIESQSDIDIRERGRLKSGKSWMERFISNMSPEHPPIVDTEGRPGINEKGHITAPANKTSSSITPQNAEALDAEEAVNILSRLKTPLGEMLSSVFKMTIVAGILVKTADKFNQNAEDARKNHTESDLGRKDAGAILGGIGAGIGEGIDSIIAWALELGDNFHPLEKTFEAFGDWISKGLGEAASSGLGLPKNKTSKTGRAAFADFQPNPDVNFSDNRKDRDSYNQILNSSGKNIPPPIIINNPPPQAPQPIPMSGGGSNGGSGPVGSSGTGYNLWEMKLFGLRVDLIPGA